MRACARSHGARYRRRLIWWWGPNADQNGVGNQPKKPPESVGSSRELMAMIECYEADSDRPFATSENGP